MLLVALASFGLAAGLAESPGQAAGVCAGSSLIQQRGSRSHTVVPLTEQRGASEDELAACNDRLQAAERRSCQPPPPGLQFRAPALDPKSPPCGPGRAGPDCTLGIHTVYRHDEPYLNFVPSAIDLTGWSPPKEIYERWAAEVDAKLMVEVGVWKGLSSVHLANTLKAKNEGILFAVDTWLGAVEFWNKRITGGAPDPTRDLMFKNGYPGVYYQFLSNIVQLGLEEFVSPFPSTSSMAADFFNTTGLQADLIHIDASHEYPDVKLDIERWYPLVRPCGILMGDDWMLWPGVTRAVEEFASKDGLRLSSEGVKWRIKKPGKDC